VGTKKQAENYSYSKAAKSGCEMTQDQLFKKASRFNMGQGISLDKNPTFFEDGHWSLHYRDLVLHKTLGWIGATKSGLTDTHFDSALEAADFFETFVQAKAATGSQS
jgi:hypothetical protein